MHKFRMAGGQRGGNQRAGVMADDNSGWAVERCQHMRKIVGVIGDSGTFRRRVGQAVAGRIRCNGAVARGSQPWQHGLILERRPGALVQQHQRRPLHVHSSIHQAMNLAPFAVDITAATERIAVMHGPVPPCRAPSSHAIDIPGYGDAALPRISAWNL
nr:hypothetical protein [Sandarakinorhabdus limnophila]